MARLSVDWRSYRTPVLDSAQYLSTGLLWGALSGLAIGGVGGRLAMLVLRLTSDPALAGAKTDDDFTIGAITGDSVFLLALGTIAGAVGGVVYALFREWLPRRLRPPLTGLLAGVGGGALIVEPGGIDFTVLEPLLLAVVMFIALPAAYGVMTAWLIERAYARRLRVPAAIALVIALLPILSKGVSAVIGIPIAVAVMAANRDGAVSRMWRSRITVWLGRAALAVLGLLATRELIDDVTGVL